ncbi:peroxiredoxin-like family protein [Roseivivax sp. CAU 1753]
MPRITPGHPLPDITLSTLSGQSAKLGAPQGGHDWQMVVVYRGLHCPICKSYLKELQDLAPRFAELGVDLLAVSADPEEKARVFASETGVNLPIGYDLSVEDMQALGLFVSQPRSPQETDRPFAEPALIVVNAEGNVQIVDLSNAPFARPDLQKLMKGIGFIREKDYPIRGTLKAA